MVRQKLGLVLVGTDDDHIRFVTVQFEEVDLHP